MTIPPLYETVVLKMPLEAYAKTAVMGGIWLAGEMLAQQPSSTDIFLPDPACIHMPRHQADAMASLSELDEGRRLYLFVQGFLALPYNGAQETFLQLLVTHSEALNEALRVEWSRRLRNRSVDNAIATEVQPLPKLLNSR
jgi:hypothetical protein